MNLVIPDTIGFKLTAALKAYPQMRLAFCDEVLYRRFRVLEPSLVSCLDQLEPRFDTDLRFLAVYLNDEPVGVTSLIVQRNQQKTSIPNAYGRIDLVIVAKAFREFRLGKMMVFAALVHMLEVFEHRLYSISCLAAHPAIEAILAGVGFEKRERGDQGFVHMELRTDETDVRELVNNLVKATAQAARVAAFRCRSRKRCSTTNGTSVAGTGRINGYST